MLEKGVLALETGRGHAVIRRACLREKRACRVNPFAWKTDKEGVFAFEKGVFAFERCCCGCAHLDLCQRRSRIFGEKVRGAAQATSRVKVYPGVAPPVLEGGLAPALLVRLQHGLRKYRRTAFATAVPNYPLRHGSRRPLAASSLPPAGALPTLSTVAVGRTRDGAGKCECHGVVLRNRLPVR